MSNFITGWGENHEVPAKKQNVIQFATMKKIPYEDCFLQYNGYPVNTIGFDVNTTNGMCLQGNDGLDL